MPDRQEALNRANQERAPRCSDAADGALSAYTIREAQMPDLDRLADLLLTLQDHLEAANPGLWRMKDEARGQLKVQVSARLTAQNSCVLVAEHDRDGVIAVILGRVVTNSRYLPERTGAVDQAFVRADHRRLGVGTRLVSELCRFFAIQEVDDLSLRYVVGNTEAEGFWEALGFAPRIVTVGAARRTVEARLEKARGW